MLSRTNISLQGAKIGNSGKKGVPVKIQKEEGGTRKIPPTLAMFIFIWEEATKLYYVNIICIHPCLTILDEVLRPVGPAQLPARHGEGLTGRPNGDGAVPHAGQRGYAHHLVVVVHHMLVHVITDHQHVVFVA